MSAMNRHLSALLLACALAASVPGALQAGEPAQATLNLKDVDIGVLVQAVSEMTGRSFIVDPKVQGKVTVAGVTVPVQYNTGSDRCAL